MYEKWKSVIKNFVESWGDFAKVYESLFFYRMSSSNAKKNKLNKNYENVNQ